MTTWFHYPFSHPWMPTLKRKLSDDDSGGDSSSSHLSSSSSQCSPPRAYHSPKRRRYDLSRNLSRLSLFERVYPIIEEPQQQQYVGDFPAGNVSQTSPTADESYEEMPISIDIDLDTSGRSTAIVEEPMEPAAPSPVREVRMRNSSSYELEKDRIVITDLDSSESESEQDDSNPFTISSTILSKLKNADRTFIPRPVSGLTTNIDASKAVVLYRPSPWAAADSQGPPSIFHTADHSHSSYEDAMETE